MKTPLWTPSKEAIAKSQMTAFIKFVNQKHQQNITQYNELHRWSIANLKNCWTSIWDFCDVIASKKATQILKNSEDMEHAKWFEGAKLNFAENLLRYRDDHQALIFEGENNERKEHTYSELFDQVAVWAQYLKDSGVTVGDRVVAFMPNSPETIIAMLATTSIGAIWSSCSADFGLQGLLDRFEQIEPKILFAVEGHQYNGKKHNHLEKIAKLQKLLPTLEKTIVVPFIDKNPDISTLKKTSLWTDVHYEQIPTLRFEQLPFNHPAFILYSSGTTGKPKCMVHGAGGTLLQHLKELQLHTDLRRNDVIFFYTTCGWMMWNWLVSSLTVGATLVLYDGSPLFPKPTRLLNLIDRIGITVFGVGAKLIESLEKSYLTPKKSHQLKSLRTVLTTGSPLLPESFTYVYKKIKSNVCLSSISGGSDIVSCFMLGNPNLPVYCGELQCAGIGMDVRIFNEAGKAVVSEKGELVCASPFPCQPIYFWNDPNGEKYHAAYFETFPNVWAHGDYAMQTEHNGFIIYGRSDATLNPGGVRIGTAEIYQQVEQIKEVLECLVVGQNWKGSERIILFVVLRPGEQLTEAICKTIKDHIRKNISSHHVPAKIIAVPELPRTLSGKIVELAVKNVIHNKPVKNTEALANPETLKYFENLTELKI